MAKIIVIDAIDSAGKGTQTNKLVETLRHTDRYNVYTTHFPTDEGDSAYYVHKFLNGGFDNITDINPVAVSMMYILDMYLRFASELGEIIKRDNPNDILILDRYITSIMLYQSAMLKDNNLSNRIKFCEFINDLGHFKLKLPRPDAVFLLKVHPELAIQKAKERAIETNIPLDTLEKNTNLQRRICDNFNLLSIFYYTKIIDCDKYDSEGKLVMKSINEIHGNILSVLQDNLIIDL